MNKKISALVLMVCSTSAIDHSAKAQDFTLSASEAVNVWSNETQVTVLPAAKTAALSAAAYQFGSQAIAAGIKPMEFAPVGKSISEGGSVFIMPESVIAKWESGYMEMKLDNGGKYKSLETALSSDFISLQLRELPRIVITIDPVPPRDYIIVINNNTEYARERDKEIFAVEPGPVKVKVTRENKENCEWEGVLGFGDEEAIHCSM